MVARKSIRLLGCVIADRCGMAAVEFAMLLPVMLIIYLGGFDLTREVDVATKTTQAARTLVDLVSLEQSGQNVPSLVTASAVVAGPYASALKMTVTSVDLTINALKICCDAKVQWSVSQNGTPRPCVTLRQVAANAPFDPSTIPASIATRNLLGTAAGAVSNLASGAYIDTILIADVSTTYRSIAPGIGLVLNGPIQRHVYAMPRTGDRLTLSSAVSNLPAGQTANAC